MSEHQANLALVERAESAWKVGKNFNSIPPIRKKTTLWKKFLNFSPASKK